MSQDMLVSLRGLAREVRDTGQALSCWYRSSWTVSCATPTRGRSLCRPAANALPRSAWRHTQYPFDQLRRPACIPREDLTDCHFRGVHARVRSHVGGQGPSLTLVRKASVEAIVHERGVDLGAVRELVIEDLVAVDYLLEAPGDFFTDDVAVALYSCAR